MFESKRKYPKVLPIKDTHSNLDKIFVKKDCFQHVLIKLKLLCKYNKYNPELFNR